MTPVLWQLRRYKVWGSHSGTEVLKEWFIKMSGKLFSNSRTEMTAIKVHVPGRRELWEVQFCNSEIDTGSVTTNEPWPVK